MADVVATSSDARLGAIRLAWWREQLEALDLGGRVPAEPRLQLVARELLPRGIGGEDLSQLEDGWLPLLATFPWGDEAAEGFERRGRILFGLGARLLGGAPDAAQPVGALWSLVDGARHCSDARSRSLLMKRARDALRELPRDRPPKPLRGLTVLAALAAHDVLRDQPLELVGGTGRLSVALAHRWRGTMPRG